MSIREAARVSWIIKILHLPRDKKKTDVCLKDCFESLRIRFPRLEWRRWKTWGILMNGGEDWSEATTKEKMSKWHSQTEDAPFVNKDSGRDKIFSESSSSRSDLAVCWRWIKFPRFARRFWFPFLITTTSTT